MLASTINEIVTSDVTHASDDDQRKTAHIFQYNLNTAKTKKLLVEGALRANYEREEKKECINLMFNDGAYNEVVLKVLVELKNGNNTFFLLGKRK